MKQLNVNGAMVDVPDSLFDELESAYYLIDRAKRLLSQAIDRLPSGCNQDLKKEIQSLYFDVCHVVYDMEMLGDDE